MKIVIIKLGAKGDVVRTLSILPAIKKKYPNSEISWITKPNIAGLLKLNSLIDNIETIPYKIEKNFDILYNFDIEEEATTLAKKIKANEKFGFSEEDGFPITFNSGAEYYLNTLFDDNLKKENKKSYQQMMFEAADLSFDGEKISILLKEEDLSFSEDFIKKNQISEKKLLGIHMGAGVRWPSKAWSESKIKDLIKKASEKGYEIILFGGPEEIEKHNRFTKELQAEGIKIYQNDPHNSDREFASLMNLCEKIICSDSFALHIASAFGKKATALFFCTTPHEVEGYNNLTKIVSPMLYDFFPEKQDQFSDKLVNSISVEEVLKTIED